MSDSDLEFDDDLDLTALDELEQIETAYAAGTSLPPKSFGNLKGLKQRDLFGGTIIEKEIDKGIGSSKSNAAASGSSGGSGNYKETVAKVKIVKRWDLASFSKHGWSKRVAAEGKARKGKGKGKKAYGSDEEGWDDEDVLEDDDDDEDDDVQYPLAELLPIKWLPDSETSKTWVYPVQDDKPLRTYQYNIVHRALFADTLVSLPTGLGKTFIAACVMLNFYRWYPRGKIIFLAPSRPLVAQQIKACHYIAGIPQGECVELTGQTAPKLRAVAWATKRVIYCTPQTMENDLKKGRLDPRDVTCLVVDEAHRASGDYAYCGVVRFMMSRNQHFRVLALTATPGSKGDAVQDVVDNLHIGRIEVRTDDSMDIKQYIHTKTIDLTVVPLGQQIVSIRDRWGKLMSTYMGPLLSARLIYESNPTMISAYGVQLANGKIRNLPGGASANGKYWPMVKVLASMARAMEYLIVQSLTSFHESIKDIESTGAKTLTSKPEFRELLRDTRNLRDRAGYVGHPKMEKLRSMCIEHFKSIEGKLDDEGNKMETRVMIFCNYRAVVDEIVGCLNQQKPLIKATAFVGQSSANGSKGRSQKDQIETIRQFKKGTYNVLVATSIGEEGLDIGEIDLIVCYEANKSPIRMLQRVGRTGRARDGRIIVLMAEGREEKNWDKAKDAYNDVQNALISNKVFELYCDGDRMLPPSMKPEVEKIKVKALPLVVETMTAAGEAKLLRQISAQENKNKKKRDDKLNVPDDAFMGFRTAGQLAANLKVSIPISPGLELRERKEAALLTVEQEAELRDRWRFAGSKAVTSTAFDIQFLPFERGFTGSANSIPTHSSKFNDALNCLRTCEQLDDSQVEELDKWSDKMSNAYDPKLVRIWDRSKRSDNHRPHNRITRPTQELLPASSFPCPTASLFPVRKLSSPEIQRSPSIPSFERILPAELTKTRCLPSRPTVNAKLPTRSIPSLVAFSPVPIITSTPRDEFGILSSDPEDLPPVKTAYASNSTYNFDGDDGFDDLPMSDGELLRGAVVNGGNEKGKGKEAIADITIDSDDEGDVFAVPKLKLAAVKPDQPVLLPIIDEIQSPLPSPIIIPDSDEEIEDFKEDFNQKDSIVIRPQLQAKIPPTTTTSDDEYGFYDLPEEAELEALETAAAIQSRAAIASVAVEMEIEEGTEDAIMPPPLPTIPRLHSKVEPTIYKKRPQHHRIPDSDSSIAEGDSASRLPRSSNQLIPSFDESPVVVAKKRAASKKFVVPDSSSPDQSIVAGPSKLNRLRRGRQVEQEEEEVDSIQDDSVVEPKKKKQKRIKLDAKTAARTGLFDVEAVNSSASGSEASSEQYSQENSDDLVFAGEDWEIEADSPGQNQFYRDSLATQAPAGFAAPYRRRDIFNRPDNRPVYNATPARSGSIDTYSFDSFCVDDDEEEE